MYDFLMKNNDSATWRHFSFDSSTFSQHWCPKNKAKQRFHEIFVRQFYVFATSRRFSFDSSTFSQHWCPENKAKQRFEAQNVRQFYVFAIFLEIRREAEKERKKKHRKYCAQQAKSDFEAFHKRPKNNASAIGVFDFVFSRRRKNKDNYQKRRFRLRGVEKSGRSEKNQSVLWTT